MTSQLRHQAAMTKYLLIGGNGVIGHFVARRLVAQGHRPIVMSRGGDTTLIADIVDDCDLMRADMTDAARVNEVVRDGGVTHILHLGAALPSVTEIDPIAAIRLNLEGSANVLEAARKNGVKRVVMASSKAVYGEVSGEYRAPTNRPIPESQSDPATMYGITKFSSEMLGRWYARTHGFEFIALRFAATVGPGKIARHGGSYSRYSVVLEHAMGGKPVVIRNGADAVCDVIFNDEAARGIVCAMQSSSARHDVYNIATGTGFTLRDYAAAVKRRFPAAEISFDELKAGAGSGSGDFVLDPARARDELQFIADSNLDNIVGGYVSTMELLGLAPDLH